MEIADLIYRTIETKGVMTYLAESLGIAAVLFATVKQVFSEKYAKQLVAIAVFLASFINIWLYMQNMFSFYNSIITVVSMCSAFIVKYILIDMSLSLSFEKTRVVQILIMLLLVGSFFVDSIVVSTFNYYFFSEGKDYNNINLLLDIFLLSIILSSQVKYYLHRKKYPYV